MHLINNKNTITKHFETVPETFSSAEDTYSLFLTSNLLIKSFPSSETLAKASSSKSQSQAFTFFRVSISFSPANGDRPLNLNAKD